MVVFICDEDGCIYSSPTWQVWVEHVKGPRHNRVPCTVEGCYSSFPARRYYLQHFNEQHKEGRSTFVCSLCARPYKTKRAAKVHCNKPCPLGPNAVPVEVPAVPNVGVPVMVGYNDHDLGVVIVTVSATAGISHSSGAAPVVAQSGLQSAVSVVASTSQVVSSTVGDTASGGGEASVANVVVQVADAGNAVSGGDAPVVSVAEVVVHEPGPLPVAAISVAGMSCCSCCIGFMLICCFLFF